MKRRFDVTIIMSSDGMTTWIVTDFLNNNTTGAGTSNGGLEGAIREAQSEIKRQWFRIQGMKEGNDDE